MSLPSLMTDTFSHYRASYGRDTSGGPKTYYAFVATVRGRIQTDVGKESETFKQRKENVTGSIFLIDKNAFNLIGIADLLIIDGVNFRVDGKGDNFCTLGTVYQINIQKDLSDVALCYLASGRMSIGGTAL